MSKKKRQHYVPKLYLRNFSLNGKLLSLFTLKQRKALVNVGLDSQCYGDYFYADDDRIEDLLCEKVEGPAHGVIAKILASGALPQSSEDVVTLYNFALTLHGRTAAAAQGMGEFVSYFGENILKEVARSTGKFTEEQLRGARLRIHKPARESLGQTALLLPLVMDLKPALLQRCGGTELITSDHPVVLLNPYLKGSTDWSVTGWALEGLQVVLPLSPDLALFLYDAAIYRIPLARGNVVALTVTDTQALNALQVLNAQENLYFRDPAQGPVVETLFREHGAARQVERTRSRRIKIQNDDGEIEEVLHTYRADINFIGPLSFAEVLSEKERIPVAERPFKERIPALVMVQKMFWKAVRAGRYQAHEFERFLQNERARRALVGRIQPGEAI